jgi:tRNA nucleotidyltransferase/poly(A) polymerase
MDGLRKKVSKERVGSELKQMLQHKNVFLSFENFQKFNVFPYMIEIPSQAGEIFNDEKLQADAFNQCYNLAKTIHDKLYNDGRLQFTQHLQ